MQVRASARDEQEERERWEHTRGRHGPPGCNARATRRFAQFREVLRYWELEEPAEYGAALEA